MLAVIDDDERQLEALAMQLTTAGYNITGHASAESFLQNVTSLNLDCLVADICLPKLNGLQLLRQLKSIAPYLSTVFITGHGDIATGVQAMREGAIDCLEKPLDEPALLNAIRIGIERSRQKREELGRRLDLERRQETLTPREREVFRLITSGMLNKQVGAELGPSENTVKKHRARVMNKMGADSLADLVRIAEILAIHSQQ